MHMINVCCSRVWQFRGHSRPERILQKNVRGIVVRDFAHIFVIEHTYVLYGIEVTHYTHRWFLLGAEPALKRYFVDGMFGDIIRVEIITLAGHFTNGDHSYFHENVIDVLVTATAITHSPFSFAGTRNLYGYPVKFSGVLRFGRMIGAQPKKHGIFQVVVQQCKTFLVSRNALFLYNNILVVRKRGIL